VDDFYSGLKEIHPDANLLLNRFTYAELHPGINNNNNVCVVKTLFEKVTEYKQYNPNCIISNNKLSDNEISEVEICTRDQSLSEVWINHRKGMITASNFKRVILLYQCWLLLTQKT
jgi:hypothetical protein